MPDASGFSYIMLRGPDDFSQYVNAIGGFFFFGGLEPGRYLVYGNRSGTLTQMESLDLAEREDRGNLALIIGQESTIQAAVEAPTNITWWTANIRPKDLRNPWTTYTHSGDTNLDVAVPSGEWLVWGDATCRWMSQTQIVYAPPAGSTSIVIRFPAPTNFTGIVLDETGNAVEGASVFLDTTQEEYTRTTAADGQFSFDSISPSHHKAWAQKDEQLSPAAVVEFSGSPTNVSLTLRSPAEVSGRVSFGGRYLEYIGVEVVSVVDGECFNDGQTDSNGVFSISGLPAGPAQVVAWSPSGELSSTQAVTLLPGEVVSNVDFTLPALCAVTVTVVDAQSDPVSNANVTIRPPAGNGTALALVTDESGRASAEEVSAGDGYRVEAAWNDDDTGEILTFAGPATFSLAEPGTNVLLQFPASASVSGLVHSVSVIGEANVWMFNERGGRQRVSATLIGPSGGGQDFAFSVTNVLPGRCHVCAQQGVSPYALSRMKTLDLTAGQTQTGMLLLVGTGGTARISGTVCTTNGLGVSGATVYLGGASSLTTNSAPDGSYAFNWLAAGSYAVRAQAGWRLSATNNVTLAEDEQRDQDLVLPSGGIITGRVTSADGGAITGAYLRLWAPDERYFSTNTDSAGSYAYEGVQPGLAYDLSVLWQDMSWQTWTSGIAVAEGQTTTVNIAFPPPGSISGRVINCLDDPVTGAVVSVQGRPTQAVSDSGGFFQLTNVIPGSVSIQAVDSTNGRYSAWTPVDVPPGTSVSSVMLRIELPAGSAPQVTYCYPVGPPDFFNANRGELLVGGPDGYLRVYVAPTAAGASLPTNQFRFWIDCARVPDEQVSVYAPGGFCSLTLSPPDSTSWLGLHQVLIGAIDSLGNGMRYTFQFTGVPAPRINSAQVSPALFSPNGDGTLDTLTVSCIPSMPANCMIYANLAGTAVQLSNRGDGVWQAVWSGATLPSGSYDVLLYGQDYSHRSEISSSASFVGASLPVEVDTTPPLIEVTTPARTRHQGHIDGLITEPNGMSLLGVGTERFAWTNELPARAGPWSCPLTMAEGANTFWIMAIDALGNWSDLQAGVTLDTHAPTVAIGGIDPENDNRPILSLSAAIADVGVGVAIADSRATLDGSNLVDQLTWDGSTWSGAVGPLADGEHTLRIDAADGVSNVTTETVTFNTVRKPPKILSRSPAPDDTFTRFTLTARVVAEDWSGLGLSNAVLSLNGSVRTSSFDATNGVLTFTNDTALIPGTQTLAVVMTDNLGQQTDSAWSFTYSPAEQFTGCYYYVPSCKMYSAHYGGYVVLTAAPATGRGPAEWLAINGTQNAPPWDAFPSTVEDRGQHGPNLIWYDIGKLAYFYNHSRDWLEGQTDPDQPYNPGPPGRGPNAANRSRAMYYALINTNCFPGDYVPVFFRNSFETAGDTATLQARCFPGETLCNYSTPDGYATFTSRWTTNGGWLTTDPLWIPKSGIVDGKVWVGVQRDAASASLAMSAYLSDPIFTIPGPRIDTLLPADGAVVDGAQIVTIGASFRNDTAYGALYDIDPASVVLRFEGQGVRARYNAATRTVTAEVSPARSGQYAVTVRAKNKLNVETVRTWHFDYVFYGYLWQSLTYGGETYRVYARFERNLEANEVPWLAWGVLRTNYNPHVTGLNIIKRVNDFGGNFRDYLVASPVMSRELIQAAYRAACYRAISPWTTVTSGEINWVHVGKEAKSGAFLYALGELTGQDLAPLPQPMPTMKDALVAAMVDKNSPTEIPETYDTVMSGLVGGLGAADKLLKQFDNLKEARAVTKYSKTADRMLNRVLGLKGTIDTVAGVANFCATTAKLTDDVWRTIFEAYWQAAVAEDFRDSLQRLEPAVRAQDPEVAAAIRELVCFNPDQLYDEIANLIADAVVKQTTAQIKTILKEGLKKQPYALAIIKGIDLFYTLSGWTGWDDTKASAHHGVYVSQVEQSAYKVYTNFMGSVKNSSCPSVEVITAAALASRIHYAGEIQLWEDCREIAKSLRNYYTLGGILSSPFMEWAELDFCPLDYDALLAEWDREIDDATGRLAQAVPDRTDLATTSNEDIEFLLGLLSSTPLYGRTATLQAEVLSPVWVLITDPQGRRVGTDTNGVSTNEIDGAVYSGPDAEPVTFSLPQPTNGSYQVDVFGVSNGAYHVVLSTLGTNGQELSSYTFEGEARPGVGALRGALLDEGDVSPLPPAPLAISDPVVTPLGGNARLEWQTTVAAQSRARLGITTGCSDVVTASGGMLTNHTATVSNLNPAATYYYRVSAEDAIGRTLESETRSFRLLTLQDSVPPAPPSNVVGQCGPDGSAVLAWAANIEPDLAGYRVAAVLTDGTPVPAGSLQTYCCYAFNLGDAANMRFAVVAQDAAGNTSALSQVVSPVLNPGALPGDLDGDGMPDEWEAPRGLNPLAADSGGDADGDNLDNGREYSHHTDPQRSDTDGDGLTDGAEVSSSGTDPTLADTDGDGLGDGVEVLTCGTNPRNPDTDNDGMGDGDEVAAGTSPTNPADALRVRLGQQAAPQFVIRWHSVSDRLYRVYFTTNLLGTWSNVWEGSGNGEDRSYTNEPGAESQQFFRLVVSPQ
jgi:hypothetical protein